MALMGALHVFILVHGFYRDIIYQVKNMLCKQMLKMQREIKYIVVEGIKGRSVLSDILDLVKCVPIDYMHCILEGVTKWLVNKWFTSTYYHKFLFYIIMMSSQEN